MDFILEIFDYFKTRKKYWLAPVLLFSSFFAILIFAEGTFIAPFIYSLA